MTKQIVEGWLPLLKVKVVIAGVEAEEERADLGEIDLCNDDVTGLTGGSKQFELVNSQ